VKRIGAWLIGSGGTLSTTLVTGTRAIARGLVDRVGLVTELPEMKPLSLVEPEQIVFGGWDIAPPRILERTRALAHDDRAFPPDLVETLRSDLEGIQGQVRPGYASGSGPAISPLADAGFLPKNESLGAAAERLGNDIEEFRARHRLDTVVVVNLASTEAPIRIGRDHRHLESFVRLIQQDRRDQIVPSVLYAYVALDRGFPYVNFTPSLGASPPALHRLAEKHHVPHYGNDGKTGETLMKTVLAPLFRFRNLEVLSWEGFNILGGLDGKILSDPRHKRSKVRSKGRALSEALGYHPHTGVSIEYVPSLGNWKTAWDFIHFRGFLGTKMSVQFVWQGCDAILAAPLVLDLVRLTEFAHRKGEAGPLTHLACFFKDPIGVRIHSFMDQVGLLLDYAARHARGVKNRASVTERSQGSRGKRAGSP
jgi:myo-inositol-1-phosphate synthase